MGVVSKLCNRELNRLVALKRSSTGVSSSMSGAAFSPSGRSRAVATRAHRGPICRDRRVPCYRAVVFSLEYFRAANLGKLRVHATPSAEVAALVDQRDVAATRCHYAHSKGSYTATLTD